METIFANSLGTAQSADDYESTVRKLIEDADDYDESYLSGDRAEAQQYYKGELPAPVTKDENGARVNRSSIVSTDVRDTIMSILPSLIRIFASSENVVHYTPTAEIHQEMAEQATDYARHVFWKDNEGFMILHTVFKDALTTRAGIVQVSTDRDVEVMEHTFHDLTPEQYQYILFEVADTDVEVIDLQGSPDGMIEEVTFRFTVNKPVHRIEAVPPEEFRISRDAKSLDSAALKGRQRNIPVSDILKKGYDYDDIEEFLTRTSRHTDEAFIRNPALVDENIVIPEAAYGEYFIRVDKDGDGIDELRHICVIGDNYNIVKDEIASDHQFALFSPDPTPHTVIGASASDWVLDIQKIKTNMMRANLDNLAESNNPRTVVNELNTNIEDALNDEVGAVIRTRGDPATAVAFAKTPYVGGPILENIKYLDMVRTGRTGISEASKGLDPKALQSTALTGIDAIVSGAQERIELVARILAETGFKRMFYMLLREFTNNPNKERVIQVRGKFIEVNPSLFDPNMKVTVNPTLGKGTDMIRVQALQDVKQTQVMIMEKFGVDNPLVTPIEFRNTLADILDIVNIKNVGRYFKNITPEIMEQIAAAPKEPDPAALLAQAELEKVKAGTVKAISDREVSEQKMVLDQRKAAMDDDFKRDQLRVWSFIDLLNLQAEQYQATVEAMNQGTGQ